ncbi:MAG: lipid-A-disaccharide synthase [Muribaculaceae bacterium]|nr:lipid-A-disaccharide synthase [Muribaculaceae bacterium]
MKYFISAGEASGDLHASFLISALRTKDPEAEFCFLGGDLMEISADRKPLVHYKQMAFMGFVDVLMNLRTVLGNLKTAKQGITDFQPDALILVDYPSFNLKLAEFAHKRGIPVFYYISPKVWAWKEHRVKKMKKVVRKVYSILPFEVDWFKKHDYDVTYVGNPSKNEVDRKLKEMTDRETFLKTFGLGEQPIIALVPGSRISEIKKNLPVMMEALKESGNYQPVIAAAPAVPAELYAAIAPGVALCTDTFALEYHSVVALVTSGTATLEAALIGTPQIVTYRAVGSRLVYNIFKHILKVKYVSLPNLIMDRMIVPELLLHQCTPDNICRELKRLLPGGEGREAQQKQYEELRQIIGETDAAQTTASHIISDLKGN